VKSFDEYVVFAGLNMLPELAGVGSKLLAGSNPVIPATASPGTLDVPSAMLNVAPSEPSLILVNNCAAVFCPDEAETAENPEGPVIAVELLPTPQARSIAPAGVDDPFQRGLAQDIDVPDDAPQAAALAMSNVIVLDVLHCLIRRLCQSKD
jgi:hypothetical protein